MDIDRQKSKASKRSAPTRRYDDEILSVNWNPAVAVIATSCHQVRDCVHGCPRT